MRDFGAILLAESIDEALELAAIFAPEHLELLVEDPWGMLGSVRNAGAVFMGHFTPEPVGDYWAGPNHVLPTGGSARCFSPLGVQVFLKRTSIISFNQTAFSKAVGPVALPCVLTRGPPETGALELSPYLIGWLAWKDNL